jgi:hypothetical protein
MEKYGSRWKCRTCGIAAHGRNQWWQLRRKACAGPCAMRAASSRALVHLASIDVTACLRCGAWATRCPRRLLRPCPGVAPTYATKQSRMRIRKGLHPTAKVRNQRQFGEAPKGLRSAQVGRASWMQCLGAHGQHKRLRDSHSLKEPTAAEGTGSQRKRVCVRQQNEGRGVDGGPGKSAERAVGTPATCIHEYKPPGERARTPPAVGVENEDAARERERPPYERAVGTPAACSHEYKSPGERAHTPPAVGGEN